jgi:hypothetical protein
MVAVVCIDPTDPATIYTLNQPSDDGRAAFRTRDGGNSWDSILDTLLEDDLSLVPFSIAVNPSRPEHLYLGAGDRLFVSFDQGDSWQRVASFAAQAQVYSIVFDPTTTANAATTVVLVGTSAGLFVTRDGGSSWVQAIDDSNLPIASLVTSIKATFPQPEGTSTWYVAVSGIGIFRNSNEADLTRGWRNLNTVAVTNLPPAHTFDRILIDYTPRNANRLYAWFFAAGKSVGLFTTSNALSSWTLAAPTASLPSTSGDYYTFAFAVAPNSPGDGENDVLFFTPRAFKRSVDSGATWADPAPSFHDDAHAFAFFWNGGDFPLVYLGTDGGIGMSTGYADPSFDISKPPPNGFNEEAAVDPRNGWIQNLNHGLQASACRNHATPRDLPSLGYIVCQDTGMAAGVQRGWHNICDADAGSVAATPGADGVKVWYGIQVPSQTFLCTDDGTLTPNNVRVVLDDGGADISNSDQSFERGLDTGPDANGYAGVYVFDRSTTLQDPVSSGNQTATPASMRHIHAGTQLAISDPVSGDETVVVTAARRHNFDAGFAKPHAAGVVISLTSTTSLTAPAGAGPAQWISVGSLAELSVGEQVQVGGNEETVILATDIGRKAFQANLRAIHDAGSSVRVVEKFVVRLSPDGEATQISQNFSPLDLRIVAAHPRDVGQVFCVTTDNSIWVTTQARTANAANVWTTQPVDGTRFQGAPSIVSVAFDTQGFAYVLLSKASSVLGPTTALYQFVLSQWVAQPCSGLPNDRLSQLVMDPIRPDNAYVVAGSNVFRGTLSDSVWTFENISSGSPRSGGLPKQVEPPQLTVANVGTSAHPKIILRASVFGRGLWERDATDGTGKPRSQVYIRKNILDQGWVIPPIERRHPFQTTRFTTAFESPDMKFDVPASTAGKLPAYQTDGEVSLPLSYVWFDELRDRRTELRSEETAWIHAQVHNRSLQPIGGLKVWGLYCVSQFGLPPLNALSNTSSTFDFWAQFTVDGQIVSALPGDAPWKTFGPPIALPPIDAENPQVASWQWKVPVSFDLTNFCVIVFVHGLGSPLRDTSVDALELAIRQRQVGVVFFGDPCQRYELRVEAVQGDIDSLQQLLEGASGPEKADIIKKIAAKYRELGRAERDLARCQASHTPPSPWEPPPVPRDPCAALQAKVDELSAEIDALEDPSPTLTPSERSDLLKKMRALSRQLGIAERELNQCRESNPR